MCYLEALLGSSSLFHLCFLSFICSYECTLPSLLQVYFPQVRSYISTHYLSCSMCVFCHLCVACEYTLPSLLQVCFLSFMCDMWLHIIFHVLGMFLPYVYYLWVHVACHTVWVLFCRVFVTCDHTLPAMLLEYFLVMCLLPVITHYLSYCRSTFCHVFVTCDHTLPVML